MHTDQVFPLHSYRLWNKKILFDWKLADERTLSELFAKAVFSAFQVLFPGARPSDVALVPVPPRKGKIKKKGWDQIQELCFYLRKMYSFEVFNCLERKSRSQQKKLSRMERLAGKGKSYSLNGRFARGKNLGKLPESVLLVDDVITTGVTVEEIAQILKEGGVKIVNVISLFIVD